MPPPISPLNSSNGWLSVFSTLGHNRVPGTSTRAISSVGRHLKAVRQAGFAPTRNDVPAVRKPIDPGRHPREEEIAGAIRAMPHDLARQVHAQMWALKLLGASSDHAKQRSLRAIERAADAAKRGSVDEAHNLLRIALNELAASKINPVNA